MRVEEARGGWFILMYSDFTLRANLFLAQSNYMQKGQYIYIARANK